MAAALSATAGASLRSRGERCAAAYGQGNGGPGGGSGGDNGDAAGTLNGPNRTKGCPLARWDLGPLCSAPVGGAALGCSAAGVGSDVVVVGGADDGSRGQAVAATEQQETWTAETCNGPAM